LPKNCVEKMIGELAALGAAVSWTVSAVLYKKALMQAKPVSANIIRLTCTAVVLLALLVVLGKTEVIMSLPQNVIVLAIVSGVIGLGVGDTLYMMSLRDVGVARAVPITCTYPLFNLLWAVLLAGEAVTFPVVLGAVIIVLGIWLLSQADQTGESKLQTRTLYKGLTLALATAVVWSVSIAMINMAVMETPDLDHALAINVVRVMAVAVTFFAVSPVMDRGLGFLKMNRKTIATLITGGIVALGLGWFFLSYSFVETLESRAVPISSTTPLFSTLTSIVLLHEKVTAKNAAGSTIIVIGIFLIFLV
jgi:DME family drug/metabolite transporter